MGAARHAGVSRRRQEAGPMRCPTVRLATGLPAGRREAGAAWSQRLHLAGVSMLATGVLAPECGGSEGAAAVSRLALVDSRVEPTGVKAERLRAVGPILSARPGRGLHGCRADDAGGWVTAHWHGETPAAATRACQAGELLAG